MINKLIEATKNKDKKINASEEGPIMQKRVQ